MKTEGTLWPWLLVLEQPRKTEGKLGAAASGGDLFGEHGGTAILGDLKPGDRGEDNRRRDG